MSKGRHLHLNSPNIKLCGPTQNTKGSCYFLKGAIKNDNRGPSDLHNNHFFQLQDHRRSKRTRQRPS